jgi:DNA-damage-inducible protein J
MKDAVVRARIDPSIKADAEKIFHGLGISTTEAIRMFLVQVNLRRGLPFGVELPPDSDIIRSSRSRQSSLDCCYDD